MSYKYFGRLAGKTNADVALAHTAPANTHTPFNPQAPATKFLAYGENSTSLAFNRALSAIATNLDYFAGILDAPALRDDLLSPTTNQTANVVQDGSEYPGFSALVGLSGNTLSLGVDGVTTKKVPPTWVFVGLHKAGVSRNLKVYGKQTNFAQASPDRINDSFGVASFDSSHANQSASHTVQQWVSSGTQVLSPTGVKLYNDGALSDYFSRQGTPQVVGNEQLGMPSWIPPIQPTQPDLPPYNRLQKALKIDRWSEDGPIIGGEGDCLGDYYVRPGCFLQVVNANDANNVDSNNGLYYVAHIEKSLDSGVGGKGDKVVLTRGGLHCVTVETSSVADDFVAGDLIKWASKPDHADSTKGPTADKYAYVAYIVSRPDLVAGNDKEKKDLYLATFSSAEDFHKNYANGSSIGSRTGLPAGVSSLNSVGLADQEAGAEDHWYMPNGTVIYNVNSAETGVSHACIPANYPVKFRTNIASANQTVTPHNPLGFVLNPTLTFTEDGGLIKNDYYVHCRTLSTVKERLMSGGNGPSSFLNDDPASKLGFTESDERALTNFAKMVKVGPYYPDNGDPVGIKKYTYSGGSMGGFETNLTSVSSSLNSGFSPTLNHLGGALWRLTLQKFNVDGNNNHQPQAGEFEADEELVPGQIIAFIHPLDTATADHMAMGVIVSIDGNDLVLFGGWRVLNELVTQPWADPIVIGSTIGPSWNQPDGSNVAVQNSWKVTEVKEAPYIINGISRTAVIPSYGLDSAYHADTSSAYRGPGSGNTIWMAEDHPIQLMMPGDYNGSGVPSGQKVFDIRGDDTAGITSIYYLLHSIRSGASVTSGLRAWTRSTFAEGQPWHGYTYNSGSVGKALEFTDQNNQMSSNPWIPFTSYVNHHFHGTGGALYHVQDKSILGGIAGATLGGKGSYIEYSKEGSIENNSGGYSQYNGEYSAFSTRLIAGAAVDPVQFPSADTVYIQPGAFLVLGTKYEYGGGTISIAGLGADEWSFVYVDFSTGFGTLGLEASPKTFSHPFRVYLHRVRKDSGADGKHEYEDMRTFANRIDEKIDLYVGRKHDVYSHNMYSNSLIDGGSNPNALMGSPHDLNSKYESGKTHFGSLRDAFQYIEILERVKETSATWPGSLHTIHGGSDHYSTSYTVHVVSDTLEYFPPEWDASDALHYSAAVMQVPADGITVRGHLSGHPGGIGVATATAPDSNGDHIYRYSKDSRPKLPTIFWRERRPLIDFCGRSGVIFEDLSFKWEGKDSRNAPSSDQNSDSWDISDNGHFGPNHDGSASEPRIRWNNRLGIGTEELPRSVLFINTFTNFDEVRKRAFSPHLENMPLYPGHRSGGGAMTHVDDAFESGLYTNMRDRGEQFHLEQCGDIYIKRVSLVGGSGFLWFESSWCPSYRNIVVEDCNAKRVTDLGVYIRGASGQSFITQVFDINGTSDQDNVLRLNHSPHEKVVVRGCSFSQYGYAIPTLQDGSQGNDSWMPEETKRFSWSCRNQNFGAGIHVSCARTVLIEDNIITADPAWHYPTYGGADKRPVTLDQADLGSAGTYGQSFQISEDVTTNQAIQEDLRRWFNYGYQDVDSLPANPAETTWSPSLHRIVKIGGDPNSDNAAWEANIQNGMGYITTARIIANTSANTASVGYWELHIPHGAVGREYRTYGNNAVDDFLAPASHTFSLHDAIFGSVPSHTTAFGDNSEAPPAPTLAVAEVNFWRTGVEVTRIPDSYGYTGNNVGARNDSPSGVVKAPDWHGKGNSAASSYNVGSSAGSPFMPVSTYVGQQDVIVRGNNISFIAKEGIHVEGSTTQVLGNTFSAFLCGEQVYQNLVTNYDVNDPGYMRVADPEDKAAIRCVAKIPRVEGNTFKPMFLGTDAAADKDFESNFFEYPSLGYFDGSWVDFVSQNYADGQPGEGLGREIYVEFDDFSGRAGKATRHRNYFLATSGADPISPKYSTYSAYLESLTSETHQHMVRAEIASRGVEANAMVLGNTGFPIRLKNHHGIIVNNNTQGGDISVDMQLENPGSRSIKTPLLINGNVLSATFRSLSGSIKVQAEETFNTATTYKFDSVIITDNNLQAIGTPGVYGNSGLYRHGTIDLTDLNTPKCWVQHNLPKHVNVTDMSMVDTYPMAPRIMGGIRPGDLVGRPADNPMKALWDIDLKSAIPGGDNVPRAFSGYTQPAHIVQVVDRDGTLGWSLNMTGINDKNTANPVFPSLTMFGNPFSCGINPGGIAGACANASVGFDGIWDSYDHTQAGETPGNPAPEGYYSNHFNSVFPYGSTGVDTAGLTGFMERRPYWHIYTPPGIQVDIDASNPQDVVVPTVWSVFLDPKIRTKIPVRVKQITLTLKGVFRTAYDFTNIIQVGSAPQQQGPPSRGWTKDTAGTDHDFTAQGTSMGVVDDPNYYKDDSGSLHATFGVRAFINRPYRGQSVESDNTASGTRARRENIGQWLCHNMHDNLVDAGTTTGTPNANLPTKQQGTFMLQSYINHDPSDPLNGGNQLAVYEGGLGAISHLSERAGEQLTWPNFGKVAREQDGFNRSNYGLQMYCHNSSFYDAAGNGTQKTSPAGGIYSCFTAGRETCNGIMQDAAAPLAFIGAKDSNAEPYFISTGSSSSTDFHNDGFVDVPLSMKLKHFSMSGTTPAGHDPDTGLGGDVDNIITSDDTIELQFYTWPIPRYSAEMSIRVSSVRIEYEFPTPEELESFDYDPSDQR